MDNFCAVTKGKNAKGMVQRILDWLYLPVSKSRKKQRADYADGRRVQHYTLQEDAWEQHLKLHMAYDNGVSALLEAGGMHVPEVKIMCRIMLLL